MNLGEQIIALRDAKGWSMNELARRSGLNPPTLQKIEKGLSADPSVSLVVAIARALGTSVEDLLPRTARERSLAKVRAATESAKQLRRGGAPDAKRGSRPDLSLVPAGPTASVLAAHQQALEDLQGRVDALEARPSEEATPRKQGQRGNV